MNMDITKETFTPTVNKPVEPKKEKIGKEVKDESVLAISGVAEAGLNEGAITEEKKGSKKGPDKPIDVTEAEAGPVRPEPTLSQETARTVANIDSAVLGREKAYADLGELARKDIYYGNDKRQEELNARVSQTFEMQESDSRAYADASKWDRFKHNIGFGRNEIQEVDGRGIVDTRKLDSTDNLKKRDDARTEEEKKEESQQIADSLLKSGVKPEDIASLMGTIKTSYKEQRSSKQEGRVVKIVERSMTEDETAKAAAKIIEADLTGLEKGQGADLIKNKESLEKHKESGKGLKELTKDLGEAATKGIEEKMAAEEAEKVKTIDGQEKALAAELNKFRTPLEGRLKEISDIVDDFSTAFEDLKIKESTFAERVRNFDAKIRQAEKSGLLQGTKEKLLQELNTQKAQDAVDLAALKDKRETVQKRLTVLQKDKAQTEKMLERINRIGKTREDLRKEQEAARAAAEAAKSEAEAVTPPVTGETPAEGASTNENESNDSDVPKGKTADATDVPETPVGAPKVGATAGEEKPAEGSTEDPSGAEAEPFPRAGEIIKKLVEQYPPRNIDKAAYIRATKNCFLEEGETKFVPEKKMKEKAIRSGVYSFCMKVLNMADTEIPVQVDYIMESLKQKKEKK